MKPSCRSFGLSLLVGLMLLAAVLNAGRTMLSQSFAAEEVTADSASAEPALEAPAFPAELRPNLRSRGEADAPTAEELEAIKKRVGVDLFQGTLLGNEDVPPELPKPAPAKSTPRKFLERKQLLRNSAFELERVAHHFEQLELYERADELRALADDYRQEARGL